MADLPDHVRHLRSLAGLVNELIVVDSQSSDGTMEYLRHELSDCPAVFLDHPPGLYPSWNHAIAAATQEYLTVATVGDHLPADSLQELYRTIESFNADAVVTAPRLIGLESTNRTWPVHHFIEATGIRTPTLVPGPVWLLYALCYMPNTLLGSSSANLYRTRLLQEHPFPHEFGHPGDSVWSLQMSLKARWVIHPGVVSYFTLHEESPHRATTPRAAFVKIREISREIMEGAQDQLDNLRLPRSLMADIADSIQACGELTLVRAQCKSAPSRKLPAFLDFRARRLRSLRRKLKLERNLRIQRLNDYIRQARLPETTTADPGS